MKNLKELSLLGLALIAFGAVGCGDDSSDTDTGDTGTNVGDSDSGTSNGGSNFGGEPDEFTECTGGASYDYVLSTLVVPNAIDGLNSVDGFDIDGLGGGSCGEPDFSNKRHQNVDNALAANLNALNVFLDINDALDTTLNSGNLVIVLRLAAVDSFINDDCVNAEIYLGATADGLAPQIDQATGGVAANQNFVLDGEAQATINAVIDGGLIEFTAPSVPLSLTFENTLLNLSILEARLDGLITADGLTIGMIGGGLTVPNIVALLGQLNLEDGFSGIISKFADVQSASGECDVLSLGAGLTGVSATIQAE